ncbi:MAG: MFS transporter [Pseudonocardia sediminis]
MVTEASPARGGMAAYRDVLRLPGVGGVTAVALAARIPATAVGVTMTLHVVLTLGYGYAAAGLVAAAVPTGMAIGGPVLGSLVDKRGLRPMLLLTMLVSAGFWAVAPLLGYGWLLGAAFVGGMFALPVFSVVRQVLAAAVPAGYRRPAFAMDSMSVELSYMTGPAAGSLLTLWLGSATTMRVIGAGFLLAGVVLLVLDPPVRAAGEGPRPPAPPVREWLTAPLVAALLAITAAIVAIMGTELAFIASLTGSGQAWAIAVVNAVWCVASLVGGFVYGAARRAPPMPVLLAVLGAATLPAALGGAWWTFALLLLGAGLFTAPTLAAGSDTVATLAPDRVRGLVTGLQGSATTVGIAVATPLSGVLVDTASPAVAILVCGSIALVAAGVSAVLLRRPRTGAVS